MFPKGEDSESNSVNRSVVASLPIACSLLVGRASKAKPDRYSQPMMRSEETLQCLATSTQNKVSLTCAWHRGLSVDHQPSWRLLTLGINSQSDEATGNWLLPWPQTANVDIHPAASLVSNGVKMVANTSAFIHSFRSITIARPYVRSEG